MMPDIDLPKVIGLCGRMYAGKTTVAEHLCETYGYKVMAFGDSLKRMLIDAGMCTHDECYGRKTEKSRWLLQKVGTEIFRKQIHPDFWVQRVARQVHEVLQAGGRVVFDDVRFPNEARMINAHLGMGLLVKIERLGGVEPQGVNGITGHESETAVDNITPNYIVTAAGGDVDKLCREMDLILANRRTA